MTIEYQVSDNLGQITNSTITVEVVDQPAPTAVLDTGSAPYNQTVTLQPWLNDSPGIKPAGFVEPAPKLINKSIRLRDPATIPTAPIRMVSSHTAVQGFNATTVTTDDGTYVVDTGTGTVVFTPVDGFVGTVTSPVPYQITNNWTGPGGVKSGTALLIPTIGPPGSPDAKNDFTQTNPGKSVELDPVANDLPGDAQMDPTTILLCGLDEIAPGCTKLDVTTADGHYVVDDSTGLVTFTPRIGFTGRATVPYIIFDVRGLRANSNLYVTVADSSVPPKHHKKHHLAKTGGQRPDLLFLFGLLALLISVGLRIASRKKDAKSSTALGRS
jgi:hypothetical protein